MNNGCNFNPSKRLDSWEKNDDVVGWIILFWCILVEILGDQIMHVKTCVQNNSIQVIGHNYMNNGCTFNPSKQMDSWEDKDEDCNVDHFI